MTATDKDTIAFHLKRELSRRKRNNPRYSQRAFARDLRVSPGRLSELLAGKRCPTLRVTQELAARLGYSDTQKSHILRATQQSRKKRKKLRPILALEDGFSPINAFESLTEDVFAAIAEWHYYAVLSLMRTSDFRNDIDWIAARLGITSRKTKEAMERLERLGLIRATGQGWERTGNDLTTSHDVPSSAIRMSHQNSLELAGRALREAPLEERDITSVTMAIDPSKVTVAKKLIKNFRRGLAEVLTEGDKGEVYNLTIALFPLSNRNRAKR